MTDQTTAPPTPTGPALIYVDQTGATTEVDRKAPADRRDRRLLRSLAAHALELCDKADEADKTRSRIPAGFQPTPKD